MQPGRQHHTGRRRVIPLPLTAGVQVGVHIAADQRHRLGARRPDRHRLHLHVVPHAVQQRRCAWSHSPRPGSADRPSIASVVRVDADRVGAVELAEGRQSDCGIGDFGTGCHSATCTAQSSRPRVENSRVPSSGSMIQTRPFFSRARSSLASSLKTPSSGRSSRSRSRIIVLARLSPAAPSAHGSSNPRSSRTPSSSRPAASASSAARAASVRGTAATLERRPRDRTAPIGRRHHRIVQQRLGAPTKRNDLTVGEVRMQLVSQRAPQHLSQT